MYPRIVRNMDHLNVHVSDTYIGTLTLFVFPASLDSSHLIWEDFIGLCDIFSLAFTLQLSFNVRNSLGYLSILKYFIIKVL